MPRTKLHSIAASPDAQGLTDHISVRIVRLSEILARIATQHIEARWGLRNTDLRLLNILDGADGLTVGEISRRTHVDKAWVSRSLRDLEARGLVSRSADATDSRLTRIALTPHGQDMLEQVRPQSLRHELQLLKGIDARALKATLDLLEANAVDLLERGATSPSDSQS